MREKKMGRKHVQASRHMVGRARGLRQDSKFSERLLWSRLRDGRCGGLKFRRQQPLGKYVGDYYCASARIVLELDGKSHVGRLAEDKERQAFLEGLGIRVIRFTNEEVLGDVEAVVAKILRACGRD